jgi:hypothetical protein
MGSRESSLSRMCRCQTLMSTCHQTGVGVQSVGARSSLPTHSEELTVALMISGVTSYHSIAAGRDEYHDGGWLCHDGGQIKAEHLTSGTGGRTKLCPVCKKRRDEKG